MKKSLVLTRIVGIRLLGLCVSTAALICFAQGQSADDVHIFPQNSRRSLESPAPSGLVEGLPAPNPPRPLHVDVDVVLVPVTVNDSRNRPVTTLKKQDFALFEEDKP